MSRAASRYLVAYATLLTAVFAFTVFAGLAPAKKTRFDEIDVQRINLVEPDGTLRMVLSNHARLPGVMVHGKEQPPGPDGPRPQAGMIFLNDEASEIGGLIFGGRKNDKGEIVDSGGAISFDRYEGNQIVQLIGVDDKDMKLAGLLVVDSSEKGDPQRRLFAGRAGDGNAKITLSDAQGRKRLVLEVTPDGKARVAFLDEQGNVTKEL
jgi:hypothetical protein